MRLYLRMNSGSSSHGHESASFSDTDLTEPSDTGSGTHGIDQLFEVQTLPSTSPVPNASPPPDVFAMHTRAILYPLPQQP
mgnify:CR=1 FL=1